MLYWHRCNRVPQGTDGVAVILCGMLTIMKPILILLLYDRLRDGEEVDRAEFCKENAISVRTFYRYLQEIRDYLRLAHRGFVLLNDRGATYRLRAKEADGDVSSDVGTAETNRC